jgi:hypothetical protein
MNETLTDGAIMYPVMAPSSSEGPLGDGVSDIIEKR